MGPDYYRSKEESERLIFLADLNLLPKREWLKHRLSNSEVIALEESLKSEGGRYYSVGWLDFASKNQPGDELWDYITPQMGHHVWHGFACVRNDQPVHGIYRVRWNMGDSKPESNIGQIDPHQTRF